MKRFVIFVLLGPALGFVIFILRDIAGGKIFGGLPGVIIGLPFAYLFGVVPALIMWLEDVWLCERIPLPAKVITSTITGYLAVILVLWLNTAAGQASRRRCSHSGWSAPSLRRSARCCRGPGFPATKRCRPDWHYQRAVWLASMNDVADCGAKPGLAR